VQGHPDRVQRVAQVVDDQGDQLRIEWDAHCARILGSLTTETSLSRLPAGRDLAEWMNAGSLGAQSNTARCASCVPKNQDFLTISSKSIGTGFTV
jgi:hypothetical protein